MNSHIRMVMDEVFGNDKFRNEMIWTYSGGAIPKSDFPRKHDTLLKYRKGHNHIFNFESKREIISIKNEETGEMEEHWTGDFIFENEWQSFRTQKDRGLELKPPFHECAKGRYKVAVKVVDIFGNDTMKIVGVTV